MTKYLLLATVTVMLVACGKEKLPLPVVPPGSTHPVMAYKDLQNKEVKYGQYQYVDVDSDGTNDILFNVLLLGDPLLQRDRVQFYANSGIKRNLLNNTQDESPMLNKGDSISKKHNGYDWWEISAIVLAEKIIDNNGSYWQGLWKNADHKYLPIQFEKNSKLYHGWIELSFNTTEEKLILHKAAISTEEQKSVQAGI
ncbi:MAG TPA: hypothetical protein VI385_02840 [Flavisolibacter sp.]